MFLLNPIIKYIAIASALILGYSFWAIHERNIGYQKAKDAIMAESIKHQNKVDETAKIIEEKDSQINDPASQLQKFWSEP